MVPLAKKNLMLDILHLALPMSVANAVAILAIIINTAILGSLNHYNLYLLALFLPINYFQIAVLEAFRAPALVLSAMQTQQKEPALFRRKIISLIMIASVTILLSVVLFVLMQNVLLKVFNVSAAIQIEFIAFTRNMLLLGVLLCANTIFNSILYGVGKPRVAMGLSVATAFITCSLTYVFGVHYYCGINGLIIATAISNSSMSVVALIILYKLKLFRLWGALPTMVEHKQVVVQVGKIATPIWGSYVILFSSLLLFNKILTYFGAATVAGFGVAYRLQTFLILPAIAIGMAIAVLINRHVAAGEMHMAKKILPAGIFLSLLFYLIVAPIVYLWRMNILALITHDVAVLHAGAVYLSYAAFSYLGLGPLLVFLIMLDQTGFGMKSLCYSLLAFVVEGSVGGALALHKNNVVIFYQVIAAINFLSLFLVFFECLKSKRNKKCQIPSINYKTY